MLNVENNVCDCIPRNNIPRNAMVTNVIPVRNGLSIWLALYYAFRNIFQNFMV